MKKFSIFMSLLLVLALLLSACSTPGEEDTGELEPTDIFGAPDVTDALGTEDLGLDATATLPATPTEDGGLGGAGGAGADGTTTPAAGETAQATGVMTGTLDAGADQPDISRLSNLMDLDIQGSDGEAVADVENVVLNICEAQATHVVGGFGGFLEIGETTVAIPWASLQIANTDTDGDGQLDPALTLNATQEQLENAPGFNAGELDFSNPDWDAEFQNFWNQLEAGGVTTDTAATPAPTTEAVEATQPVTGTNGTEAASDRCVVLANSLLADLDVQMAGTGTDDAGTPGAGETGGEAGTATPAATGEPGAEGTGIPFGGMDTGETGAAAQNEVIGDVQDVVLDPETGEIRYLVVAVNALDLNGNWVLVPPQAFSLLDEDPDDDDMNPDSLVLNVSAEDLANAPTFEPDALPDTSVDGWDADLETFWSGIDMTPDIETTP